MLAQPTAVVLQNLGELLQNGHLEVAHRILNDLFEACSTHYQAKQLLQGLQSISKLGLKDREFERTYIQTLCRARQPQEILDWFARRGENPALLVYKAWALVRHNRYHEALELLKQSQPATPFDWAIYYRSLAEALFWTGSEEWLSAFEQAQPYLSGPALGRALLDKGTLLHYRDQQKAARVCWAEALAHLEKDPYYLAWAHNSLGFSLLHEQPQKAEYHLLKAHQISKKKEAEEFRARAMVGLGAVRRSLGEWDRALYCYQQASKGPGDSHDLFVAAWGWGHVLRLMGRTEEAYARLLKAAQMERAEAWIEADLAAARLMLGDCEGVAQCLPRLNGYVHTGHLGERGKVVLRVLEAELMRVSGQLEQARAHLSGLDSWSLWYREEVGCFAELSRLTGTVQAEPALYKVEVQPFGSLEVRVNGRQVPIPAVSKAGELLVFLLLHGKQASLEVLLDRLGNPRNKQPRKALWEIIEKLRRALGWKDSIQNQGGVYVLDPQAEWHCHTDPQSHPESAKANVFVEFMPGYYSEWILEWRQGLLVV